MTEAATETETRRVTVNSTYTWGNAGARAYCTHNPVFEAIPRGGSLWTIYLPSDAGRGLGFYAQTGLPEGTLGWNIRDEHLTFVDAPDVRASPTTNPERVVGYAPRTVEEVRALPIGTQFGVTSDVWTKTGPDEWERSREGGTRTTDSTHFSLGGHCRIIALAPAEPAVGQALRSQAEFDALPVGTVVGMEDERITKEVTGLWTYRIHQEGEEVTLEDGAYRSDNFHMGGDNTILRLAPQVGDAALGSDTTWLYDLPIGTVLNRENRYYTKIEWDTFRRNLDNPNGRLSRGRMPATSFARAYTYTVTSMPGTETTAQPTSPFPLDHRLMDRAEMARLLPGTVIGPTDAANRYVMRGDETLWVHRNGIRTHQSHNLGYMSEAGYNRVLRLPPSVGDTVDHALMNDLLPGSVLTNGSWTYGKADDGSWTSIPAPGSSVRGRSNIPTRDFACGGLRIASLGSEPLNQITVNDHTYTLGQRLPGSDRGVWLVDLPVGTVLRKPEDLWWYTKTQPTRWRKEQERGTDGERRLVSENFTGWHSRSTEFYVIESLPGVVVTQATTQAPMVEHAEAEWNVLTPVDPYDDTIAMFRQRVAACALGMARQAGSSYERPVPALLDELGIPRRDWVVEPGWVVPLNYDGIQLPDGTLVRHVVHHYWGLAEVQSGHPTMIANSAAGCRDRLPVLIENLDGSVRRPTGVTIEDYAAIHALRLQIDEVGTRAKAANSWCGTYETSIVAAGVLPSWRHAALTPEEVRELPEGTLLRNLSLRTPLVYRRTGSSTNPAGTERISTGEGHYAELMVPLGGRGMLNHRELASLPEGTRITYAGHTEYRKTGPFEWSYGDGGTAPARNHWTHVYGITIHSIPTSVQTSEPGRN